MGEQQQHEMVLEETLSSGVEKWYCPSCGRRMMITWQPWTRLVLEPGDLSAAHIGSKGGIQWGPVQFSLSDAGSQLLADDDPYLTPWKRWLDKVDPDDFWGKEL